MNLLARGKTRGNEGACAKVLPADCEVVVDTSGFTQDPGPSAKVKLAPAGLIPELCRPIDHLSLLTFDATSDAHLPARLQ